MSSTTASILGRDHALVGMIHLAPLPGSPDGCASMQHVIDRACDEARMLAAAGFDAMLIENMHDRPYLLRHAGPGTVAAMTAVGCAIRQDWSGPLGVQVLAGDNIGALSVAKACHANFIRAEGFVFASIADEGLMGEADAGPLLRARRELDAEEISIFADIKKKHSSHAITADIDIAETAKAADFCRADGVVLTGTSTGMPVDENEVESVRDAVDLPILIGSGVTPDRIPTLFQHANALIIGSALKADGQWNRNMEQSRLDAIIAARG